MALVAGIVLAVVAIFAYLGGWLTPSDVTPAHFADEFERVDGHHDGFRRNHAKGVCVSGYFESSPKAADVCKSSVFKTGRVQVIGRFSLGGGNPYQGDTANNVRGLGLQLSLPGGEQWRMAMINLPVFPVRTPAAFYERMVASEPDPATGKPDPDKMKAFGAAHPESVAAIKIIMSHPPSSGFDNTTFNSLNAFWFVDGSAAAHLVRWSLVPIQPFTSASTPASTSQPDDKNFLFDGIIARLRDQTLAWHLIITLGQAGDPSNDATIPWPADREQVDVGTLTLDHVEAEETSPARDINFDPLILPEGILPSDDPLLSARSAVYSQSYTRRSGETKQPSAITPSDVQK